MNKKKYIAILVLLLLGMLCMAGASAWIIADPFTVLPLWHDAKPKFYVQKTVEFALDGAPPTLGDIKRALVFLNEDGEDISSSVGGVYITTFTDGETTYSNTDATTVDLGTTYRFQISLNDPPAEYTFGGTYESYDGDAKSFSGIERGETNLLFKYKTVRLNGEFYTAEDALSRMPDAVTEESAETVAIVEHDTAFAHPDVARAAGYLHAGEQAYPVRGTLLVPYAQTAVGYMSTGLMDSEPVDDPGTSDDDAKKFDPVIRANAKTFTEDYDKTEPPAPHEKEPYVTLTLPKGVELSVTGRLVVNAAISSSNGNTSRANGDYYGELNVEAGAHVSFECGSTFDCMGFARGEGELIARKGANVFEPFNIVGWKGGGNTLKVFSAGIFPLSQYTVSSIVARTVFEKGAVYSLRGFVGADSSMGSGEPNIKYATAEVKFISAGKKSEGDVAPFLQIDRGTVTKEINESNGKLHFIADGDIHVNNLGLGVMGIQVSTLGRDVPVPGHLEMVINSGTTTIPEDVSLKMLPGAHVRIEKGATLVVAGKALSYGAMNGTDAEGNPAQGDFQDGSLGYPISRLIDVYRVKPDLGYDAKTPARVVVNGRLTVENTATVAAEIESEGGGVADIDASATLSCEINEYDSKQYTVPLTSKWWHGDGETDDVRVGQWKYIDNQWIGPSSYTVRYHLGGGRLNGEEDQDMVTREVTDDVWSGQMNTFTPAVPTWKYHYFEGWYLDEEYSLEKRVEGKAEVKSGQTIDLYAKWSPIVYTVYGIIGEEDPIQIGTWQDGEEQKSLDIPEAPEGELFLGWYVDQSTTGARLEAIDGTVVDRLADGTQEGAAVTIYLYGRYAREDEIVTVAFEYVPPAGNYPDIKNVTEEGISLGWTFAQAGMPATDLHKYDDDLSCEFYFGGWLAENGAVITSETKVDRSMDTDSDGTITVTAQWHRKFRLSITLAMQNNGNLKLYAYLPGFELTCGEVTQREVYDSQVDRTDGNLYSQEYTFWIKPGESFTLRFFYMGGTYPYTEETPQPDGEFTIESIDGNYSYTYTATFVLQYDMFTRNHQQTLTGGKDEDGTEDG